jgi:C-terminal processing protease CtpA/Prc
MGKTWWMPVALFLMGFGAMAGASELQVTDEQLDKAHQDLREAVETISSYHRVHGPGQGVFPAAEGHEELMMTLRRPRMGIVVESGLAFEGDALGAVIRAVTPGSPAEEAGLEVGDVITRIDGVDLADGDGRPQDVLIRQLVRYEEGDSVTVDYLRDGESRSTTVQLRALKVDQFVFQPNYEKFIEPSLEFYSQHQESDAAWYFPYGWLDMELVSLNSELGDYFGTDEGVLVVRGPESDELGLRGGDVIISIDDRIVKSPTHAMRILRSYDPEETMDLEIIRQGHHQVISASVPERRVRILGERWEAR